MKKKILGIVAISLLIGMIFISYVNAQTIQDDDTTPPSVRFSRPGKRGIYIESFSFRRIPFPVIIIIGSIQIWPYASDDESGLKCLELYIDKELKATFSIVPKSWDWDETTPHEFKHTLRLIAYDNAGNHASDEITVWKFF